MSNSAVSKRNGSILSRKESRERSASPQKNIRNFDELDQKPFSVIQASGGHTNLFNSFRLNTEKQKVPLGIQLEPKNQSNQEQKSTPLFYKASREQQVIEQTSFEQSTREWKRPSVKKQPLNNVKNKPTLGKASESELNQFPYDNNLQVNSSKSMDKKQDDYKITFSNQREKEKRNQQFNSNQFDNNDLQFGSGLEEIGNTQRDFVVKEPKNGALKGFFDKMPSVQKLHSSTFTPSNISRISNRPVPSADRLSADPSFFKRQLSSSHSQSYLKSYHQQQKRSSSKQTFNKGRLSVNPYNYRDTKRGSLTNYRTVGRDRHESAYSYRNQFVSMFHDGQGTVRRRQDVCLSLANNLTELLFKYNGGHATTLYNYRLKLKNESLYRIGYKIKCTSPRHYEVRPYSEGYLGPSQVLNVSIELKLSLHDLDPIRMKHDLSHYKRDKFKIEYWTAECQNDIDYSEGEKILPVVIDQTEEEKLRNQGLTRNISEQSMKLATEENEILVYKKLIDRNNLMTSEINGKIQMLQTQQFSHRHFTKQLFLLFVIIGLGIGVWLG